MRAQKFLDVLGQGIENQLVDDSCQGVCAFHDFHTLVGVLLSDIVGTCRWLGN